MREMEADLVLKDINSVKINVINNNKKNCGMK